MGDHPIPSGNAAAALGLLRLAALTGDSAYEEHAVGTIRLLAPAASRHPEAFGHLLQALDFHISPIREVALVAPAPDAHPGGGPAAIKAVLSDLAGVVHSEHRPHVVLAGGTEGTDQPDLMTGRTTVSGEPAAYVCEHFACKAPVTAAADLKSALRV